MELSTREETPVKAGRIILLVLGVVAGFTAVGLGTAGAVLTWVHATQRDASGFYSTTPERFESVTAAVTTREIDLGVGPGIAWQPLPRDWFTVRFEVEPRTDDPVFVGIARQRDVEDYLSGVAHDEIVSIDSRPFEVTYQRRDGASVAPSPGGEDFWVAEAEGVGVQELRWDVESGRWAVVVLNADGSPGVSVDVSAGVRTGILLPVGLGLIVAALLVLGLAVLLVFLAVRGRHARLEGDPVDRAPASPAVVPPPDLPPPPAPEPFEPGPEPYPARLDGELQPDLSRWMWLVKWFLAIPHLIVLVFLWMAFFLLTVAAFVAIVFTGRYPRGIFDFNVGVMRWSWRVTFYAFALGTDRYPPFSLEPDPDYPADFDITYPEYGLSRGLVWVKWWLLAIPHYLVVAVFGGGPGWATWGWGDSSRWVFSGGLISVLVIIAAVVLLFTTRYPRSIFELVIGLYRWTYRVVAYAALMRDDYPPFRLDTGGKDPATDRVLR